MCGSGSGVGGDINGLGVDDDEASSILLVKSM